MTISKMFDPKTNSVAPVCFAISAGAFLACILGLTVNLWLSGWMAVGGMAGIGLFYLAIGLLSLGAKVPVYESSPMPAPLTKNIDLDAEAVLSPADVGTAPTKSPLRHRSLGDLALESPA